MLLSERLWKNANIIKIQALVNQVIAPSKPILKKHTRCMMKTNKLTQTENKKLLMDIVELKIKLSELFTQSGPNTSEYISLSIKLDCLMNEYFNEKIEQLI
jgi:hypothetical protein